MSTKIWNTNAHLKSIQNLFFEDRNVLSSLFLKIKYLKNKNKALQVKIIYQLNLVRHHLFLSILLDEKVHLDK